MLILGHAGITLGAATLLAGAAESRHSSPASKVSWFTHLSSYVDIRILLIGSLLPDIIDKPVGQYLFSETFSNGRIFSHSLLFLVLITAAGFYLYKRHRKVWLLTLAAGTLMHLILDRMWQAPRTLFWPFLGTNFDRIDLTNIVYNVLLEFLSNPALYIPEAVGMAILLWFGLELVKKRRIGTFFKYGKAG